MEQYRHLLNQKTKKGACVGKQKTLQNMVKQWNLGKHWFNGDIGKAFQQGTMARNVWKGKEDRVSETEELVTWGRCIAMHGGETQAIAAWERGEVEPRVNPCSKGPRTLYSVFSVKGLHEYCGNMELSQKL